MAIDLTPKEVAAILQVHVVTVYRLIQQGDIKCYRVGTSDSSSIRITKDALEQYKKAHGRDTEV